MPQISHAYAVGRVRVLEKTCLSRASIERLLALQTPEEVARALSEMEWGDARDKKEIERLADQHVEAACKLVKECSPESEITGCFLAPYDALNLKVLLKSRLLKQAAPALSPCGNLDIEMLRRAVEENRYGDLPMEYKEAMERVEKRVAARVDPLYVDAEIDKAMFRWIGERLQKCKYAAVREYFRDWADWTNLLIALRSARMGRGSAFARELLAPGGALPLDSVAKAADEPERAWSLARTRPFGAGLREALDRPDGQPDLALLEKKLDDHLLALIRPGRYEPTSLLPLIGYLLARQREAAAVRLIVTAKAAHVPSEKLTARLRELYA